MFHSTHSIHFVHSGQAILPPVPSNRKFNSKFLILNLIHNFHYSLLTTHYSLLTTHYSLLQRLRDYETTGHREEAHCVELIVPDPKKKHSSFINHHSTHSIHFVHSGQAILPIRFTSFTQGKLFYTLQEAMKPRNHFLFQIRNPLNAIRNITEYFIGYSARRFC